MGEFYVSLLLYHLLVSVSDALLHGEGISGRNLGLNRRIAPHFVNPFLCDLIVYQGPHVSAGFIRFYLFHFSHEDKKEQEMLAGLSQCLPWTLFRSYEYSSPSSRLC